MSSTFFGKLFGNFSEVIQGFLTFVFGNKNGGCSGGKLWSVSDRLSRWRELQGAVRVKINGEPRSET